MMAFWAENQGQSPLYAKFGTVPGRNCTHVYHDKHQATHFPSHLYEQELSCWTVPGSRTGGALQDYTNWTNPELTAPASHFPFVLETQTQQRKDVGEYQPQENRETEWMARGSHRSAREREYDRVMLKEGWQRRWEPCSPVRYRREVSKRSLSDSSYRELEAWAARYSHSLPRRRRMGAEFMGASQGVPESSRVLERGSRSGTDLKVEALQHTGFSTNIRDSGRWDRGSRQKTMTYYPPQAPVPDTTFMSDTKEITGYQRRVFSQPPGYIAPPPYNGPHKSSPVMHSCDRYSTGWEQEGYKQTYRSQPKPRRQDVSVDLQDGRRGEEEEFIRDTLRQRTGLDPEGYRHQRKATDVLRTSHPLHVQNMQMQPDSLASLQQPPVQEVQKTNINQDISSNVIEGRKFKFNKKTGGTTIFCLVSRMSGTTKEPSETSPVPVCAPKTNMESSELGEVPRGERDSNVFNQIHKLADEVDFSESSIPVKPSAPKGDTCFKAKWSGTPTWVKSGQAEAHRKELHADYSLSNTTEREFPAFQEKTTHDSNPEFGSQVVPSLPPASVKYPLWREPSYTGTVNAETSKANTEEGGSKSTEDSPTVGGHPVDIEVRRLEIKKDTESDSSSGRLVIDTTCVIVRMELIPSPKKEHVHYICSPAYNEYNPLDSDSTAPAEPVQSNDQINEDLTPEQPADTLTQLNPPSVDERPHIQSEPDHGETDDPSNVELMEADTLQTEEAGELSLPCLPPFSISEKETLEERAERILGIPLLDSVIEHRAEDAVSIIDSRVENQNKEGEALQPADKEINDTAESLSEDTIDEPVSQQKLQFVPDEDAEESNITQDHLLKEHAEDLESLCEEMSNISENDLTECQPQIEIKSSETTEIGNETLLEPCNQEEQLESQLEKTQADNNAFSQPPSDHPNLSPHSSSDSLECESSPSGLDVMPSPSLLTVPHSELGNLISGVSETSLSTHLEPDTLSLQFPSPPPSESTPLSTPSSTPPEPDLSPNPQCLNVLDQTEDAMSFLDLCVRDQNELDETSHMTNDEVNNDFEPLSQDMTEETEELVSQQPLEYCPSENTANVKESDVTQDQLAKENNEDLIDATQDQLAKENNEDLADVTQDQLTKENNEDLADVTQDQLTKENNEDLIDVTQDQLTKENNEDLADVIQDQLAKENNEDLADVTQDQLAKENNEDLAGVCEQMSIISEENVIDSQLEQEVTSLDEIEIINEPLFESCGREEQILEEETQPGDIDALPQPPPQCLNPPTDHPEISPRSSSDFLDCPKSPSALDVMPSPSQCASLSHVSESNGEPLPYPDLASLSPSDNIALHPDTILSGTSEPSLSTHLESHTPSFQFPSPPPSESATLSPPSFTPPRDRSGSVSPDFPDSVEESQYPKSLWDAVNRIRKHTAPDSENEEEEVSDLWDPQSIGEDLVPLDVAVDLKSEAIFFHCGEGLQETIVSSPIDASSTTGEKLIPDKLQELEVPTEKRVEDIAIAQIQQDKCHEEPCEDLEEDTLSCSSTNSHVSEDTVIKEPDREVEEKSSEVVIERGTENEEKNKTDHCWELPTAEEDRWSCYDEVENNTVVEEVKDERDEKVSDTNKCCESEVCLVEGENRINETVEMTENEEKIQIP